VATIKPTMQKGDMISVHVRLPKDLYKELFCSALDSDFNLQDMFVYAMNKTFLEDTWEYEKISNKRFKWNKKTNNFEMEKSKD